MGTPDSGNFDSFDAEQEVSEAVFFPPRLLTFLQLTPLETL